MKNKLFYTSTVKYSTSQLKFTVKLSHKSHKMLNINKGSDSVEEVEKRL